MTYISKILSVFHIFDHKLFFVYLIFSLKTDFYLRQQIGRSSDIVLRVLSRRDRKPSNRAVHCSATAEQRNTDNHRNLTM